MLGDALTQQLSNDEKMKKTYLGMQAQYKDKLARLALAEKKGNPNFSFSPPRVTTFQAVSPQEITRLKSSQCEKNH